MEIYKFKGFDFILKADEELTENDKQQMHDMFVESYPPFKNLYDKNGYYSTIKPQMEFQIEKYGRLVGSGKFQWATINVSGSDLKLFSCGMIIASEYQGLGLGTNLTKLTIIEAKKRGADLLFCSTENFIVEKMLKKLGFAKIKAPVYYEDCVTGEMTKSKYSSYAFEFKKELIDEINKLPKFYIGIGPI